MTPRLQPCKGFEAMAVNAKLQGCGGALFGKWDQAGDRAGLSTKLRGFISQNNIFS
jgi:hypothetical protein